MQTEQESLFDNDTEALEVELSKIFKNALRAVNAAWRPGLMEHLERNNKAKLLEIANVEDKLERVWKLVIGGYFDISDFKEAVHNWQAIHFQAIEEFKNG